MKSRIFFSKTAILLLILQIVARHSNAYRYDVRYITQKVDHFNYQNKDTFEQKLLVNFDSWVNSTGPIFFYTGNEGPIEAFADNTGFMFENAKEFSAGIVFAEHRYYGSSLPYGEEESFTNGKIGYLSIEQALADFAVVLEGYMPRKVIAFGGSYGGMLAAYMREVYPHLIHGALAASAPIQWVSVDRATEPSMYQGVTKDYTLYNTECSAKIKAGFTELVNLINAEDYTTITKVSNQCHDITTKDEAFHVLEWARNAYVFMAMMNYPYAAEFMGNLPAWPVHVACDAILKEDWLPKSVMDGAMIFYATKDPCHDAKKEFIHCADPTGCGTGPASLSWDYQACTQINLFADRGYDMFFSSTWNSTTRNAYCFNKFNVQPDPSWLKIRYGNLSKLSRVIFSNGGLDPWSEGGISTSNPSQELYALHIPLGAHHLDLRGSNPKDPADVIAIRKTEINILHRWLGQD